MAISKIIRLHFLAITSTSEWSESSSPLDLFIEYADRPNDVTPQTKTFQVNTTTRSKGRAIAATIDMPSDVCYIKRLVLVIKGDDFWIPKTLGFYAENDQKYIYSIVEFFNWPESKATTWSTDSNEGLSEIQIFPLILEG